VFIPELTLLPMGTKLKANWRLTILLTLLLLPSGCASGLLYTDIIRPECTDMRGTGLGNKTARGGAYRVELPTNRIDLIAEWNSKAIGDIAKNNGINTVYGCDQRTISVLGGIFRKEEIIVYGE